MDQPDTYLMPATRRRTADPRLQHERLPASIVPGRARLRDDVTTLGLLAAAVALSGLWIVGFVTVVRWLV